jgi:hypothetical protein
LTSRTSILYDEVVTDLAEKNVSRKRTS